MNEVVNSTDIEERLDGIIVLYNGLTKKYMTKKHILMIKKWKSAAKVKYLATLNFSQEHMSP